MDQDITKSQKSGIVRIIAGRWRRRAIAFPEIPGLRPTHGRLRETLFNWLMPYIEDACCLDLFAGSGALGFEALSRGARAVTLVDHHPKVIAQLKKTVDQLGVESQQVEIIFGRCPGQFLSLSFSPYDIVFLDPPFEDNALPDIVAWLESNQHLTRNALIYVEMKKQRKPILFAGWKPLKTGQTKRINYFLLERA